MSTPTKEQRLASHLRELAANTMTSGEIGFNTYGGAGPTPWKTWNGGNRCGASSKAPTQGSLVRERWSLAGTAEIAAFIQRLTAAGFTIVRVTPAGG